MACYYCSNEWCNAIILLKFFQNFAKSKIMVNVTLVERWKFSDPYRIYIHLQAFMFISQGYTSHNARATISMVYICERMDPLKGK